MSTSKPKLKTILLVIISVIAGIIIGGYLFSDSQPRSFLSLNRCNKTCLKPQELIGLVNSVIIQKTPGLIPKVVLETDKSVAIEFSKSASSVHYIVFPKRDIKNLGQLSDGDEEYLTDTLAVLSQLIRDNNLKEYQAISNGPDIQQTTYLHFHLRATQ